MFNYGRIYGAGIAFAVKLLMQFNPEMSEQEAKKKAFELYKNTKGFKYNEPITNKEEELVAKFLGGPIEKDEPAENIRRVWKNGSESEMFNKLEDIARSENPKTPVLEARMTTALEPQNVGDDVNV